MTELQACIDRSTARISGWEGETIGANLVAKRHGISRQQLAYYRKNKLVVAFRRGTRNFVYPEEQFLERAILLGIREVIHITGGPTEAWIFLIKRHPQLKERRPIDLLKEGDSNLVIKHLEEAKEGNW